MFISVRAVNEVGVSVKLRFWISLNKPTGTAQRTIYKQVCKRDGCKKSVAGSSSK